MVENPKLLLSSLALHTVSFDCELTGVYFVRLPSFSLYSSIHPKLNKYPVRHSFRLQSPLSRLPANNILQKNIAHIHTQVLIYLHFVVWSSFFLSLIIRDHFYIRVEDYHLSKRSIWADSLFLYLCLFWPRVKVRINLSHIQSHLSH